MLCLVYVSSATRMYSDEDLLALLEKSRDNNARLGITGMLLYKDGNFMQVLEGDEAAVRALSDVIESDPRHSGFIKLLEQSTNERQFEEWSMGFKNLSGTDLADVPGYSDYRNEPLDSAKFRSDPGRARKLLSVFRKHN